MNRFLTKMVAALALGGAVIAAAPADARRDGRWDRHDRYDRWDDRRGDRHWRGERHWRGDRGYRGGRGYYYAPRRHYYAPPRYYGYGYDYPRRHYYRGSSGGDVALGALAGIAIGAAIASD